MFNHIKKELAGYNSMDWCKLLITIGLVVLIGLFAVNQFVAFRYKAELLSTPCELCLQLNEHINLCPKYNNLNNNNLGSIDTIDPLITLPTSP
jgi:hypothetical protein